MSPSHTRQRMPPHQQHAPLNLQYGVATTSSGIPAIVHQEDMQPNEGAVNRRKQAPPTVRSTAPPVLMSSSRGGWRGAMRGSGVGRGVRGRSWGAGRGRGGAEGSGDTFGNASGSAIGNATGNRNAAGSGNRGRHPNPYRRWYNPKRRNSDSFSSAPSANPAPSFTVAHRGHPSLPPKPSDVVSMPSAYPVSNSSQSSVALSQHHPSSSNRSRSPSSANTTHLPVHTPTSYPLLQALGPGSGSKPAVTGSIDVVDLTVEEGTEARTGASKKRRKKKSKRIQPLAGEKTGDGASPASFSASSPANPITSPHPHLLAPFTSSTKSTSYSSPLVPSTSSVSSKRSSVEKGVIREVEDPDAVEERRSEKTEGEEIQKKLEEDRAEKLKGTEKDGEKIFAPGSATVHPSVPTQATLPPQPPKPPQIVIKPSIPIPQPILPPKPATLQIQPVNPPRPDPSSRADAEHEAPTTPPPLIVKDPPPLQARVWTGVLGVTTSAASATSGAMTATVRSCSTTATSSSVGLPSTSTVSVGPSSASTATKVLLSSPSASAKKTRLSSSPSAAPVGVTSLETVDVAFTPPGASISTSTMTGTKNVPATTTMKGSTTTGETMPGTRLTKRFPSSSTPSTSMLPMKKRKLSHSPSPEIIQVLDTGATMKASQNVTHFNAKKRKGQAESDRNSDEIIILDAPPAWRRTTQAWMQVITKPMGSGRTKASVEKGKGKESRQLNIPERTGCPTPLTFPPTETIKPPEATPPVTTVPLPKRSAHLSQIRARVEAEAEARAARLSASNGTQITQTGYRTQNGLRTPRQSETPMSEVEAALAFVKDELEEARSHSPPADAVAVKARAQATVKVERDSPTPRQQKSPMPKREYKSPLLRKQHESPVWSAQHAAGSQISMGSLALPFSESKTLIPTHTRTPPSKPTIKSEPSPSPSTSSLPFTTQSAPKVVRSACICYPMLDSCRRGVEGWQMARKAYFKREWEKLLAKERGDLDGGEGEPIVVVDDDDDNEGGGRRWGRTSKMQRHKVPSTLKKERVFFRDDGMVIEWSSTIPLWNDTLQPEIPNLACAIEMAYKANSLTPSPRRRADSSTSNCNTPGKRKAGLSTDTSVELINSPLPKRKRMSTSSLSLLLPRTPPSVLGSPFPPGMVRPLLMTPPPTSSTEVELPPPVNSPLPAPMSASERLVAAPRLARKPDPPTREKSPSSGLSIPQITPSSSTASQITATVTSDIALATPSSIADFPLPTPILASDKRVYTPTPLPKCKPRSLGQQSSQQSTHTTATPQPTLSNGRMSILAGEGVSFDAAAPAFKPTTRPRNPDPPPAISSPAFRIKNEPQSPGITAGPVDVHTGTEASSSGGMMVEGGDVGTGDSVKTEDLPLFAPSFLYDDENELMDVEANLLYPGTSSPSSTVAIMEQLATELLAK
ncbi:hypothetical protein BDQ12DRAFT_682011 [Crucibulum laeve]|uniref:Uncharacterized protein n=1 Tax=Crucibulum laeve TaxID=68775 RepID=A0A5C3M4A5_9AGAR|nr:hypothetical protein BDQ12DRAFT_682011 [Crucibulum laeve]